jgi:RHS repeat-associated protein
MLKGFWIRSSALASKIRGKRSSSRVRKLVEATSGIHSNAYNFLSAVNAGVDPRTGMYSCSISLPGVAANNLCGPTVGLSLGFSALNPVNAGFGIGWSLVTTRYDVSRDRLSLSTGESFRVDTFVAGKATFKDRKLRSFDLFRNGLDGYIIVHRSGMSEWLVVIPGSEGVAVLYEVRSPEGYVVTLTQVAANGIVQLQSVSDGTQRVLLALDYQIAQTSLVLHPDAEQSGVFTFHIGNDRLERLALPDGYGDGWVFGYEALRVSSPRSKPGLWQTVLSWLGLGERGRAEIDLLLLKSTTVPTGGYEEVDYVLEGHALPGGANRPLTHMPVVVECRRDPRHEQPVMRTRYSYSDRNYFGFGALNDWLDDEDNLYRVVMPPGQRYEYSSTETSYDGVEAVRTVERTFNRFHLLTSERASQDGCVKEVVTAYDENPATSFENQTSTCQLPVEVRTLYYREGRREDAREDVETYAYDTDGNRLAHRDADGAQETFTYYLRDGEDGCPRDPLGFVRCVKQKRVAPPDGTEGAVRVTRHRYDVMPSLFNGGSAHLVSVYEAIHHELAGRVDPVPLSEATQRFVTDGGADHGRLCHAVARVGGVDVTTEYAYVNGTTEADANGVDEPVLIVVETRTASTGKEDALSYMTRSACSLYSGATVMGERPDGVVTRSAYDALGRIAKQSLGEGTPFAAAATVRHALSHGKSWQEECSVTGVRVRTELDGLGRAIRRVAVDWLGDGNEQEIWSAGFDAFGRVSSETTTDYAVPLASGDWGELAATTRYTYDGWGNCAETVGPDGVVAHVQVDPIVRTEESWSEAPGSGELVGRLHTTYGKDGLPARIERRTPQGAPQWWLNRAYDGWGRRVSETESAPDMPDKVTLHRYDDFDRRIESTLPDGSVIYRRYASYSDEELVEAIGVRHTPPGATAEVDTELGQQAFDGLGRRVLFRSGTRETRYVYSTSRSSEPDEIHLPSGETLFCTYERQLGHLPTSIADRAKSVECRFDYHPLLGQLTSASNALGRQEVEYFPTGQIKRECFLYGIEGKAREAIYAYTKLGLTASFTSVDGESHTVRYDELGRVATISNGTLITAFAYDDFSRTRQVRTETVDGERSMDVSLAYDAYGREVERTLVARTGSVAQSQTITHSYTSADKLRMRRWVTSEGTREESYDYDIRGRLVGYDSTGTHAPQDPSGAAIASQRFSFDALDNMLTLQTSFVDEGFPSRISAFHHAASDPTQLIRIEHVQGDTASTVLLDYDACGNLTYDECQRELTYDAMGRLARWKQGSAWQDYRYDSLDRVGAIDTPASTRFRYYRGGQVAWEDGGATSSSFHVAGGIPVAQSRLDAGGRQTVLLGSDAQGSIVSEAGMFLAAPAYLIYGYRPDDVGGSDIAYAGELKEREVGWYLMASYRVYNPILMRFHSPDVNSPFGHGGLNAYAYVSGDPVNRVDPSGEGFMDWLPLLIGAVGTAIGVGLSFGTLAPAAAALWAGAAVSLSQAAAVVSTGLGVLSVATTAGSIALHKSGNDAAGSVLGWMSAGYGIGSAVTGVASVPAIGRAVSSRMNKVQGAYRSVGVRVGNWQYKLQHAGGMNSKSALIGTRGVPRGQAEVELAVEAVEDVARARPRSAAMAIPGSSGGSRSPGVGQLSSDQSFSEGMARFFPGGIGNEVDHLAVLMEARGRTTGMFAVRHLRKAGITDSNLIDRLENVRLPNPTTYARDRLQGAVGHFRRFTREGRSEFLDRSIYELELARQGVPPRAPAA